MGTEKYKFGIQFFPCLKTFQLILNFKEGIKKAKGVNFRNRSFGSCYNGDLWMKTKQPALTGP